MFRPLSLLVGSRFVGVGFDSDRHRFVDTVVQNLELPRSGIVPVAHDSFSDHVAHQPVVVNHACNVETLILPDQAVLPGRRITKRAGWRCVHRNSRVSP